MLRQTWAKGVRGTGSARALLVALACLALGSSVRAEPLELPTPMLQKYYAEARARGAEASEPLAHALLIASRQYPTRQRIRMLEQASLAAPHLAAPHLERSAVLLRTGDFPAACVAVYQAAQTLVRDAVQQAILLRRVSWVAHTLLLVTLGTLVVLLLLRTLPFAFHVLDTQQYRPLLVVGIAAIVVGALTYLSPVLGVLALIGVLVPFASRTERRVLATLCVSLALTELGLPWARGHAMLLDPGSASATIARARTASSDATLESQLANEVPASRERDVALGLLARRRGDLAAARRHYVNALRSDSTWAAPYVNLANIFFMLEDFQRAAAGFRAAQSHAPRSSYPHANLAQTYIRMLHFNESDDELRAASEKGHDGVVARRKAWTHDSKPVLDMVPSDAELLDFARREVREKPDAASALLLAWRGEAWRHMPIQFAPWLLLAFAGLLMTRLRYAPWLFECVRCVRVACNHCALAARDTRASLCRYCDAQAAFERPARSSTWDAPRTRDTRGIKRLSLKPPRMADLAPAWLAALFPGGADLVTGSPQRAAWTALAAWCAVLATVALVHAAAANGSPWFVSLHPMALRLTLATFWLVWLGSLLRLHRHEQAPKTLASSRGV